MILGAVLKFALHMYMAPGYGFFGDEFYTIALSKHLAFGYVDLPPLVPLLVALDRAILGKSLFAMHIVPALVRFRYIGLGVFDRKRVRRQGICGTVKRTVVYFCSLWLSLNSIFCYDSIDQLVLAGFLYTLVRFLRSGEKKLWLLLGLIAGLACMTKMTIDFYQTGFFGSSSGFKIQEGFIDILALVGRGTLSDHRLSVPVFGKSPIIGRPSNIGIIMAQFGCMRLLFRSISRTFLFI